MSDKEKIPHMPPIRKLKNQEPRSLSAIKKRLISDQHIPELIYWKFDGRSRALSICTGEGIPEKMSYNPVGWRRFLARVHQEDITGLLAFIRSGVQDTLPEEHFFRCTTRLKKEKRFRMTVHMDTAKYGCAISLEGTISDITHLRSNRQKEQRFIELFSHEVRTPLSILRLNIQSVMRSGLDLSLERMLQKADEQVGQILKMADRFLDVPADGEMRIGSSKKKTDLSSVLLQTVEQARLLYPGVQIHMDNPEETTVMADAQLITQALHNYISNAIKFDPRKRPIHISQKKEGKNVSICVRDEGRGIKACELKNVFENRFRSQEMGNVPGNGLGLYFVSRVLMLHKGKCWLESIPGRGTSAFLMLKTATRDKSSK